MYVYGVSQLAWLQFKSVKINEILYQENIVFKNYTVEAEGKNYYLRYIRLRFKK